MTLTSQTMTTTKRARQLSPSRVIVEGIAPEIDCGAFPIKRVVGESVRVEADIFAEGHDILQAVLKHRQAGASEWSEVLMESLSNDRWASSFEVHDLGRHEYTVQAWIDRFASWHRELFKKQEAGQDVASELLEGSQLVREAVGRATGPDVDHLRERSEFLAKESTPQSSRIRSALDPDLSSLMDRHPDRTYAHTYEKVLGVVVEPLRARYGAWYELFPRSASPEPGRHGTFRDVEARLPYVAGMGFDVLYLPPIHPVGRSYRKGPNNTLTPGPNDPGSPWAIGSEEGGHTDIHPELGTIDDFDRLVEAARRYDIQVSLDIAFQCSPDHPWVKEHPEWFRHRPDGTIKYAENPPKKYQDIYPLEFEGEAWQSLWEALRDVFLYWIDHGVTIFRVDNPHTKPFRFWDWCINEIKRDHPEAIFLSEAFTRPKLMKRLAKGGYSQSYTYFTWRNTKEGLIEYLTELTTTDCKDYMRPNFFANTPDILHEFLQVSGRPGFQIRQVLASTLASAYGIYGPPFEQCVGTPVKHGSEEYLDSEKYQIRHWDLDAPGNLRDFIARINAIRRENPALQSNEGLRFHHIDNDQLLIYSKATADLSNVILVAVNLDPYHTQSGWVQIPPADLGLDADAGFQVHDLLSDARYLWHGEWNYIELNPHASPAHIFRVRRRVQTERDFDYYA
ncbi:alpha-1,4-glucan--maltose-1-phosphate maltosyltransferase [soil metagenome]